MTMTTASLTSRAHDGGVTDRDDDPAAKPSRRKFSRAEKERIVGEYDALPKGSPERGAMLRREGLYTSHISEFRRQLTSPAVKPGRKPKASPDAQELAKAQAKIAKLERELERTKMALEITGKAHALLELLAESADSEPRSTR